MAKRSMAPETECEKGDRAEGLTREEYFAERELLLEARQRGYQRAEQMVLGGATGALVLSITFLEKLVPAGAVVRSGLLVSARGSLLLSLCASLSGQYISARSFTAELERLEASLHGEPVCRNQWKEWNTKVGVVAAFMLAIGIGLLAAFAYVNAPFNR